MRKSFLILAVVIFSFVVYATVSFAAVTGFVKNTNGVPVAGAMVTFSDESNPANTFSEYTDDQGKYMITITGSTGIHASAPAAFTLGQNYPNPFNPTTTIPFTLESSIHVSMSVYNIMGQKVTSIIDNEYMKAGSHYVTWDGTNDRGNHVGAGIYLYRLRAGWHIETKKMLLLDGGGSGMGHSSVNSGTLLYAKIAAAGTYTVTITHSSIIPFEQEGVTITDSQTMDFVITMIGETKIISSITLVSIPAGTFAMGQSSYAEPVHSVTVSSFEIGMFEITQGQYRSVTDVNPSQFQSGDDYPVEQVSWFEAVNFCNMLSDAAGLEKCYPNFPPIADVVNKYSVETITDTTFCDFSKNGFRLPTEAEWEYACRAGTETRYYIGDNEAYLPDAAWYGSDKTYPVGGKVENAWGLYDMHGNVSEWCNDWYGEYSADSQTNPAGHSTGTNRILRGGSWNSIGISCQSGYRGAYEPKYKAASIGFRVVRRP